MIHTTHPDRLSRPQVVLVCRALITSPNDQVLLIQRSPNDEYMPGAWEFPGGKLDAGQDIYQSLQREVSEETGLNLDSFGKVVYHESKVVNHGKYQGLTFLSLTLTSRVENDRVILSEEHIGFDWIHPTDFNEFSLTPDTHIALTEYSQTINAT